MFYKQKWSKNLKMFLSGIIILSNKLKNQIKKLKK